MGKRRYSSDDDSDDELGTVSLSSANAKRSRFGGSNGSPDGGNEELYMSQGKCSACNTTGGSTYTCLKCHKLFHEHCGAFRVDGENSGICGACLTSIILECPCCHQRGFKGVHGLRTHIGGYCKKQHSKDWRQHFREFFMQLDKRLESVQNKEISAVSIIRSHRQAASVVANLYGCSDDQYYSDCRSTNDEFWSRPSALQDYITQLVASENPKSRKSKSTSDNHEFSSLSPTPSLHSRPSSHRSVTETPTLSTEESVSNYNLRHKNSQSVHSVPSEESTPLVLGNQGHFEKNSLQNAIMDCPFCEKSGYCGVPGIRTHIRNYCPSIDKMMWRDRYLKCLEFNIEKYEKMNSLPEANVEFNNQVISNLKQKVASETPKPKVPYVKPKDFQLSVMNTIQYEPIYCEHCHDENSYCPKCGCHTCHNKHLASLLLICDGCNKEHHIYCLSPYMESIPDSTWYCPECQAKQNSEVAIKNQGIYKDRNYTFEKNVLSKSASELIDQILERMKSKEQSTIPSLFQSVSLTDLIQVQSYFASCSRRMYNRLYH